MCDGMNEGGSGRSNLQTLRGLVLRFDYQSGGSVEVSVVLKSRQFEPGEVEGIINLLLKQHVGY